MVNKDNFTSWHVSVAGEAIAAGQFARLGLDVSIQYGADQPEYDLIISKGDRLLKVSVKGSQDGSWGLTQKYCKEANYHAAADMWFAKHGTKTIFCFVQFKGVMIDQLPRIYLATPTEIMEQLKSTSNGRGDTILYEDHTYTARASAYGTTDKLPDKWKFSKDRVSELMMILG